MTEIRYKANLQPEAKKWSEIEIKLLLRLWRNYQSGALTAGQLRGQLQGRTMSAINKKIWSLLGKQGKRIPEINQHHFDFFQEKLILK